MEGEAEAEKEAEVEEEDDVEEDMVTLYIYAKQPNQGATGA